MIAATSSGCVHVDATNFNNEKYYKIFFFIVKKVYVLIFFENHISNLTQPFILIKISVNLVPCGELAS